MRGMELKNEMEEARNYIFYVSDYIDCVCRTCMEDGLPAGND
mgnify:CR=1 FL=1